MSTRAFLSLVLACCLVQLGLLAFFAGSWLLGMMAGVALAAICLGIGLLALVVWALSRDSASKVMQLLLRWSRRGFVLTAALSLTAFGGILVIVERPPSQGDEVVSLVEKYRAENGKYPCSEEDLVPRYLPRWPYSCFLHNCTAPFMGAVDGEKAFHLTCMGMPRWIYDSNTRRWSVWWH